MRRYVIVAVVAAVVGAVVAAPVAVLATHSFIDVPTTHTFHADIEWLKDADVTRGCNPPANTRYCPDDFVTRGQMAAFMRRLASNQVVDAGSLEGKTVAELTSRAAFNSKTATTSGDFTVSTQVTAPARGVLIMGGAADAFNTPWPSDIYDCRLRVNGTTVPGTRMRSQVDGTTSNTEEDCSTTGAMVVGPGTHTVDFVVDSVALLTSHRDASVWGLWVPFDGAGVTP